MATEIPWYPVVKNPPANAGDVGTIPGKGRCHMSRDTWFHSPQLLSPWATTTEAHALEPKCDDYWAHEPQVESNNHSPQLEIAQEHVWNNLCVGIYLSNYKFCEI